MAFWNRKPKVEKRNMSLDEFFAITGYPSTITVTEDKVMQLSSVRASINLIGNTIASMPVYLYKEHSDGSVEKLRNDYRMKLLNQEPNDFLNGFNFKKNMVKDYVFHGASYVNVVSPKNKILELHPLRAKSIVINKKIAGGYKTKDAEITLAASENGTTATGSKKVTTFRPYELMIALQESNDGFASRGVLADGEKIFQQALAEMQVAQNFYDRGALPLGILTTDDSLDEDEANNLRQAWENLYGGSSNSAKTIVLSDGMEYQALTPVQLDDKMSKKFGSDIYKMFGIPEGMIVSSEGKQYQSLEQNQLHFLRNCLQPIINSLENAMDKALLLETEKRQGYFFRFDTSELTRATEKERIEAIVVGMTSGLFTENEARAKLDLPPIARDIIQFPSGTQMIDPASGEAIVLNNTGQMPVKNTENSNNNEGADSVEQSIEPNGTPTG